MQVTARFSSSMAESLKTHGIVPDVIDKAPVKLLSVVYPNNITVDIGKVLTPTQVKDPPTVSWDSEANTYYTLCMTGTYFRRRQFGKLCNRNTCIVDGA